MSNRMIFFTKKLQQIVLTIDLLASPKGTSIEELCIVHKLNRRSVFRILHTIEHELCFPIIVTRDSFGGSAEYRLPGSFVESISSKKSFNICLTFNEAILLYIILGRHTMIEELRNLNSLISKLELVLLKK